MTVPSYSDAIYRIEQEIKRKHLSLKHWKAWLKKGGFKRIDIADVVFVLKAGYEKEKLKTTQIGAYRTIQRELVVKALDKKEFHIIEPSSDHILLENNDYRFFVTKENDLIEVEVKNEKIKQQKRNKLSLVQALTFNGKKPQPKKRDRKLSKATIMERERLAKELMKKYNISEREALFSFTDVEVADMDEKKNLPATTNLDRSLVNTAYEHIKTIFVKKLSELMLEVGQYLLKTFYDGDVKNVTDKTWTKNDSFNALLNKIQDESGGDVPSKAWFYNARNLAVDNLIYGELSTYRKLNHSIKVRLTNAGLTNDKKKKLIEDVAKNPCTVKEFNKRIERLKAKRDDFDIFHLPKKNTLKKIDIKRLERLQKRIKNKYEKLMVDTIKIEESFKTITDVINEKNQEIQFNMLDETVANEE